MRERKEGVKDRIIARSPFLKSFIDEYGNTEPEMWKRMVESTFIAKREEVLKVLGQEKIEKDIHVLLNVAKESDVFNPHTSSAQKVQLIFCFAWMGFEVGNDAEIGLFYNDIIKRMFTFDALKEHEESKSFIRGAVDTGVFWREDIEREMPQEIKDFFANIDFP